MEAGVPVTIEPRSSKVLVFEENGQTIFTSKPVFISDPGGVFAENGFKMTLDEFFRAFSQSFLEMSGIGRYLSDLTVFKTNIRSNGRMAGRSIGYRWISNAGGKS
jgi:hypothetical protein